MSMDHPRDLGVVLEVIVTHTRMQQSKSQRIAFEFDDCREWWL